MLHRCCSAMSLIRPSAAAATAARVSCRRRQMPSCASAAASTSSVGPAAFGDDDFTPFVLSKRWSVNNNKDVPCNVYRFEYDTPDTPSGLDVVRVLCAYMQLEMCHNMLDPTSFRIFLARIVAPLEKAHCICADVFMVLLRTGCCYSGSRTGRRR